MLIIFLLDTFLLSNFYLHLLFRFRWNLLAQQFYIYCVQSSFPHSTLPISIGNFSILILLLDFYHISSLNLPSGHLTSPCTAAKNDRMFRRILVVLSAVCLGKQSEVKIYSYHKKCQMLPLFGKINIACCSREALHRGLSCKGRILRGSNLKQETF